MSDDNKRLRKSSEKADQSPGKETLRQRKDKDRNSNKNKKPDNNVGEMSAEEVEILVHDLEVRNEELLRAQSELSQARNRYRQLYEFAPVGYLTVDKGGTIREANRTAGTTCGWKRAKTLQQLALQLSRTEQQERNRLGALLHDDLQQFLAAAIFPLEILEEQIESSEQRAAVDKTKKLVQQAMEKARTLSHKLSPPVSKQCDLAECLQWCSEWAQENFDLKVDVNIEASASELSNETKIFLLNSVRELLFNIRKHADTRKAEIYMQKIHDMLCIRVLDHGRGGDFDINENSSDNGGYGLFNINERLKALGGFMTVESEPNDGTQVCLYVKSFI